VPKSGPESQGFVGDKKLTKFLSKSAIFSQNHVKEFEKNDFLKNSTNI